MDILTQADRQRIATAIAEAEQETSGEIVCVVARAASDYRYVPICWAAIVALALPWPLVTFTLWSAERIHLVQLAAFLVVAVLLWLLPGRHVLVPAFVRRSRARQEAEQQFLAQRMYRTVGRTGCLIYIAQTERLAAVFADQAITSAVAPEVWKETIETMTEGLRAGQAADGIIRAVVICAEVLRRHAPPLADNRNELPNRVILL